MIDRVQDLEGDLGLQAEQLKERALELLAGARERLGGASQTIRKLIVEHPERALGFSLGMGVFLGWLIKRR